MYRVEPQNKVRADLTRPDYIEPIDFLRPTLGGFCLGLAYMTLVTLICILTDPGRASVAMIVGGSGAFMSALLYGAAGLLAALVNHWAWLHRLKRLGPPAYQRSFSLQIPRKQTFELCLAATGQLSKPKIVGLDEHRGEIRVLHSGPWWRSDNTYVDIHLRESLDGVTHVTLNAQSAVSDFRFAILKFMWGEKWLPLILTVGYHDRHGQLMDQVADYCLSVPNWNHHIADAHECDAEIA